MHNELAGKVAPVDGRIEGIGAGVATAFGTAGAMVAIGYARDRDGAERAAAEIKEARAIGVKGSAQEDRLLAATPLAKQPGRPSDLSPVAIFLASHASAWMTGEVLTVSGGKR